jgi:hypothetical protein
MLANTRAMQQILADMAAAQQPRPSTRPAAAPPVGMPDVMEVEPHEAVKRWSAAVDAIPATNMPLPATFSFPTLNWPDESKSLPEFYRATHGALLALWQYLVPVRRAGYPTGDPIGDFLPPAFRGRVFGYAMDRPFYSAPGVPAISSPSAIMHTHVVAALVGTFRRSVRRASFDDLLATYVQVQGGFSTYGAVLGYWDCLPKLLELRYDNYDGLPEATRLECARAARSRLPPAARFHVERYLSEHPEDWHNLSRIRVELGRIRDYAAREMDARPAARGDGDGLHAGRHGRARERQAGAPAGEGRPPPADGARVQPQGPRRDGGHGHSHHRNASHIALLNTWSSAPWTLADRYELASLHNDDGYLLMNIFVGDCKTSLSTVLDTGFKGFLALTAPAHARLQAARVKFSDPRRGNVELVTPLSPNVFPCRVVIADITVRGRTLTGRPVIILPADAAPDNERVAGYAGLGFIKAFGIDITKMLAASGRE